jgi:hypothetical protein
VLALAGPRRDRAQAPTRARSGVRRLGEVSVVEQGDAQTLDPAAAAVGSSQIFVGYCA